MDYIKNRLKELSTWNGFILLAAYVIMWFTPDNVDAIIQSGLAGMGILNVIVPSSIGQSQ